MCVSTMAAEELYVAGMKVTLSGTGTVTLSGGDIVSGTVKYDCKTKTLTLSGATIACTGNNNRGIRSSVSGLTVVFSGKNIISTTSAAGLRFEASATIRGSGTVTVKSEETALYVYKNTTVTIKGVNRNRLTLTLNGKYGIQGEDGKSSEKVSIQRYVTLTASGSDNAVKLLNNLTVSGDANVTLKGNSSNSTVNSLASLTLTEGIAIDLPLRGYFDSSKKTIIQDRDTKGYKGDITIKPAIAAINATNFPDAIFRSYVAEFWIDQNSDGYLSNVEIQVLTRLDVPLLGISDLTGIAFFTALTSLSCNGNSLESLDVSKNTKLEVLLCNDNNLSSLKGIEFFTALTRLDCYNNQIGGAAMTQLVNSLRSLPSGTEGFLYVCNDRNRSRIDNIITPAQVNIAKGKGWTVRKYDIDGHAVDYTGFGDTNGDNVLNMNDLNLIVDIIMGQKPVGIDDSAGDLNNDGKTDAADVVMMVNILNDLKGE